tara:strand:+ start:54 stop:974 length:921 start_codon:yes stop_codon:yes gene_type:complete
MSISPVESQNEQSYNENSETYYNELDEILSSSEQCMPYPHKLYFPDRFSVSLVEEFSHNNDNKFLKITSSDFVISLPFTNYASEYRRINSLNKKRDLLSEYQILEEPMHSYNTRSQEKYMDNKIILEFSKPLHEWNMDDFVNNFNEIINNIGYLTEAFYPDLRNYLGRVNHERHPLFIHQQKLIENDKLLLYGSASSLIRSLYSDEIEYLFNDIFDMISSMTDELSEPPPPERLTKKEFTDYIGVTRAIKKDCDEVCVICMDKIKYGARISKTKCGHCFHSRCLRKWLVNNCHEPQCPCCRKNLIR